MTRALRLSIAALAAAAQFAHAHPGHGLEGGSHWHAGATPGLLLAGLGASVLWWLLRRQ